MRSLKINSDRSDHKPPLGSLKSLVNEQAVHMGSLNSIPAKSSIVTTVGAMSSDKQLNRNSRRNVPR